MRAIRTGISHSSRSRAAVSTALVFVLTFCVSGMVAKAQVPASGKLLVNQSTKFGTLPGGGSQSGTVPDGDSMAVTSDGSVITTDTYGSDIVIFHKNGTPMTLGTTSNPNGVAVDAQNNLFIAYSYNSSVVKIPYVNGAYAAIGAGSAVPTGTPNCTGNDTVECVMNYLNVGSDIVSLLFDSHGNLFYTTGRGTYKIYECTAACLYTGTPAPALIFTEPTSPTPTTTGQLNIGSLAIDAAGDLFFSDSAISSTTTQESFSSNVNELVYTAGTGYAATATVIYTYTPTSVGQYGPEINGVALSPTGTLYALLQNTTGILAFPLVAGAYSSSSMYLVSTQTGKLLTGDSAGNLYIADGSGNIYEITVNALTATPTAVGAPSTATNITTILNDGGCSPAPMVTFTPSGTAASQFSAATTGACVPTSTGASYATTLTFTPTTVGTATATLGLADTNGSTGTATISGNGTGTVATPAFSPAGGTYTGTQSVTLTDATVGASIYYTTDGTTPSATSTLYSGPISVAASETINAIAVDSGDTSSMVAMATYIINTLPATVTPTFSVAAGTYTTPQTVSIYDAASGAAIYYTTDGSTPTTASTLYTGPIVVSSSETLQAIALASGFSNSAVASAAYTINLPASAFQNVVVSQATKFGTLPGGGSQSGTVPDGDSMAVTSDGSVITTDTYGSDIVIFHKNGTPMTLGTTSNPNGVAVDAQNNLFIGYSYNSSVVKIPYVNGAYAAIGAGSAVPTGTPNCTGNDTVECVMNYLNVGSDVVSLLFDSHGNLFYATGRGTYKIYECTAACLYTGTPAPAVIFTEPTSATPTTTGQLNIGSLAIDASGDLFFSDSAISSTTTQESFSSNVNELVYTAGTGYAATATVIYNYTPTSVGQYGPEINGVALSPNGTLYALLQNTTGILAFPKVSGSYSSTNKYLVSTMTGKLLTGDAFGNLYIADGGGNIYGIALDSLTATPTAVGTPSTATNITTLLNDGGCSPAPSVTFSFTGTGASQFAAVTTGACSGTATGGALATTLTFTPTAVGASTATFTATDSLNNTATGPVVGNGTGMVATPTFSVPAGTYTATQTVSLSDATAGATIYYTIDGTTPTSSSTLYTGPITVSSSETISAIGVDSGDTSSAVASAAYIINLPGGADTPILSPAGGTFTTPQAVTITDTTTGATIYYTTDGSTPTATSARYVGPVAVSATETLKAIAFAPGFSNSAVASGLYTVNLPASAFQNIVMTQSTKLGSLPGGGSQSGAEPAGDTMAVTADGSVITTDTYGNDTVLFSPQGGTPTELASTSNPTGVAVDAQNNLYMGFSYNSSVVKIPYVNGAYVAVTAGSAVPAGTPNCTGNDTVECVMSNLNAGADVISLVFDAQGDLFYATGRTKYVIYECTAACLYTGTPAPKLIFTEPTSATPTTTGQLNIGGLAIDAAGNLFFTDSAISSTTSQESFSSNLNELPYTSGTGYAATATVIYTYIPTTVGQYGPEIDGVAVTPNGTVYALVQNDIGILAFPKVGGTYSSANKYVVSSQSGKLMTGDALGNLYIADGGGNIYKITVDNLTAPTAPVANPVTVTNVTTYLNDGGCTATPPTVTFAATGPSASSFSAATTGSCTATNTGASFATSVTFNPTTVGTNSATLTATDSLTHTGTAYISATGTPAPFADAPTFSVPSGTYTTVQTVAISDTVAGASIYYTTDGSTPTTSSALYTAPITVSASETINAIANATGYQVSPVGSAAYVINLPAADTPTFSVAAGTYTTPQTVAISDTVPGVAIYYTTDGSTPTAGSGTSVMYTAPISLLATTTIKAVAFPSATAVNYVPSAVASATYTINLPVVATPAFSVAGGTYTSVQTVSLSTATTGAKIYYTLDGSTPTVTATELYSVPIVVYGSETIKAIAVDSPNYNNSVVATAVYVINLPAPGITITASNTTINIVNGTGTTTLTVTANAATNGSMGFSCSGFLPLGATCAFSPTPVALLAGASGTTTLTVTVPKTTASLRHDSSPLFPGTVVAAVLCFFGFRKRRRLQVLLLLVVSVVGLNVFTGCATTASNTASASQFVVTATGASCPGNDLSCAQPGQPNGSATPVQVTASVPLILTTP